MCVSMLGEAYRRWQALRYEARASEQEVQEQIVISAAEDSK